MKIAIVGFGDVAKYLIEVFGSSSHEIVLLSGKENAIPKHLKVEQRRTRYTLDELSSQLADCDAVVSTLSGPDDFFKSAHAAILEACTRSKNCKKFIPSEFAINIEDFPDLPSSLAASRGFVRDALRAQTEVKWTLICMGWFMDYMLPTPRRHLRDLGPAWVCDDATKTVDFYGDGSQKVTLTSAHDVARVMLALIEGDGNTWKEFTHICGQSISYRDLCDLILKRKPDYRINNITFSEVLNSIIAYPENSDDRLLAELRITGFTNANNLPEEKLVNGPKGILKGVTPRNLETFLKEADNNPDQIP